MRSEIIDQIDLQRKIECFFFKDPRITAAIKNCYLSMPDRIEKVIEGEWGCM
jgi:hypothetical protein